MLMLIISKTSHRYNWCQLAGSVSHPEKGKVQDISADINKQDHQGSSMLHVAIVRYIED